MPNWDSVLKEISTVQATKRESAHDSVRKKYLGKLHKHTNRNVIAYYSGFLTKKLDGIEINDEDKNGFMLCIHGMKRELGLDLILHTPGGDGEATVSLVDYLRSMFGRDIRALVPQLAMSAGTMVACSCRQIVMGKQSSLGPIDPQFGVIAAANLLAEVKKARDEILANPNASLFWNPILGKITPSFLERCEKAISESSRFIKTTLAQNMLLDEVEPEKSNKIEAISSIFGNVDGRAHNTHLAFQQCHDAGLKVIRLEEDPLLQDLLLTLHHCYMHSLSNTPAFKIIENQRGIRTVKLLQPQLQIVT